MTSCGALPAPLSSFVGRAAELVELAALLAQHRLVVVTGAGGCGKTRLALEVLRRQTASAFDAMWWVDLASVSTGGVAVAVADAVGVAPGPGGSALQSVVDRLRVKGDSRALVVLDNAEHVVDDVVAVVRQMLGTSEDVAALVTSRQPLRLNGEVVWRVPSLAAPPADASSRETLDRFDASRLFVDRLESQRGSVRWGASDCRAVAAICSRLDGIPFALELAAARARTMSLGQVLDGLGDRFDLLTTGDRDALPRQQTLRASLEWSIGLLSLEERLLLERLSVFAGPFTAEAAEAIGGHDSSLASIVVLSSLVDKSLVQWDAVTGRYQLLETTRHYAAAELAAHGESELARRRHATWWAHWSTEVGAGRHGVVAADLQWALSDLSVAGDWARLHDRGVFFAIQRGLGWFWDGIGRWDQLAVAYETAVSAAPEEQNAAWAGAVAGLAWAGVPLDRTEALELYPTTTRLLAGDDAGLRLAGYAPAAVAAFQGDLVPLRRLAADVIEAQDEPAGPLVLGTLLAYAGTTGYFDEADDAYRRLADLLARRDQPFTSDSARAGHYGAINLRREQGRFGEAEQLAVVASAPRDATTALTTASAAITLAAAVGSQTLAELAVRWVQRDVPAGITDLRAYVLAMAAREAGDLQAAGDHVAATIDPESGLIHIVAQRRTARRVSHRHRYIVCLLLGGGRLDGAQRLASLSPDTALGPLPQASAAYARSLVHAAVGQVGEALDEAVIALRLADSCGFVVLRIDALEQVARMRWQQGKQAVAARLIGAAQTERCRLGYRDRLAPDPAADLAWARAVGDQERTAFDEGGTLSISAATSLALRRRGRRDRPRIGLDSLTPTEHQVARLASEGFTNSAIASQLLMSPATVKTHLTRIFAKLDTPNRTALAAAYTLKR